MAKGLYIDGRELSKGVKGMQRLIKEFPEKVSDVLNAGALEIEGKAKDNARTVAADRGDLARGISANTEKPLQKHITSRVPYSAYVEFGTGIYAAQYVGSLPSDYQTFAAQFKGSKKPSIKGLLFILMEWFKRKGIKDKSHQYFIARNIFINGTHPHPFLLPAFFEQQDDIKKDMKTLLNQLRIK